MGLSFVHDPDLNGREKRVLLIFSFSHAASIPNGECFAPKSREVIIATRTNGREMKRKERKKWGSNKTKHKGWGDLDWGQAKKKKNG